MPGGIGGSFFKLDSKSVTILNVGCHTHVFIGATLVRRLYLDLIGLLPTPAEAAAFVADPRAEAFNIRSRIPISLS